MILLAVFGIFIADHMQRLNALKSVLSLTINSIALIAFALFGPVAWGRSRSWRPPALPGIRRRARRSAPVSECASPDRRCFRCVSCDLAVRPLTAGDHPGPWWQLSGQ